MSGAEGARKRRTLSEAEEAIAMNGACDRRMAAGRRYTIFFVTPTAAGRPQAAAAGRPQGGDNRAEEEDARDIKEFVEVCARTF